MNYGTNTQLRRIATSSGTNVVVAQRMATVKVGFVRNIVVGQDIFAMEGMGFAVPRADGASMTSGPQLKAGRAKAPGKEKATMPTRICCRKMQRQNRATWSRVERDSDCMHVGWMGG